MNFHRTLFTIKSYQLICSYFLINIPLHVCKKRRMSWVMWIDKFTLDKKNQPSRLVLCLWEFLGLTSPEA